MFNTASLIFILALSMMFIIFSMNTSTAQLNVTFEGNAYASPLNNVTFGALLISAFALITKLIDPYLDILDNKREILNELGLGQVEEIIHCNNIIDDMLEAEISRPHSFNYSVLFNRDPFRDYLVFLKSSDKREQTIRNTFKEVDRLMREIELSKNKQDILAKTRQLRRILGSIVIKKGKNIMGMHEILVIPTKENISIDQIFTNAADLERYYERAAQLANSSDEVRKFKLQIHTMTKYLHKDNIVNFVQELDKINKYLIDANKHAIQVPECKNNLIKAIDDKFNKDIKIIYNNINYKRNFIDVFKCNELWTLLIKAEDLNIQEQEFMTYIKEKEVDVNGISYYVICRDMMKN